MSTMDNSNTDNNNKNIDTPISYQYDTSLNDIKH
jgi:hypothetical protein